jgi:hypothetical protein
MYWFLCEENNKFNLNTRSLFFPSLKSEFLTLCDIGHENGDTDPILKVHGTRLALLTETSSFASLQGVLLVP